MPKLFALAALFGCLFLAAGALRAEEKGISFRSTVDGGFGWVDDDGFLLLFLEQNVSLDDLDLAIAGPLRFRVVDRDPSDKGALRRQDWDEVSDYSRIVRYLSFAHEWDDSLLDLYFGELNGVGIGHGSVADAYFNSTEIDHYQGGLILRGEWAGNGIELMTENLLAPDILVGRGFIAPLSWFVDGTWPRRMEIGYTLGADIAAPYRVLDRDDKSIPVTGFDISFRLIDEEAVAIMPYVDFMIMDGEFGLHAGAATGFTLSKGVSFHLRGEYRYLGSDYHPAIFNPFYEYTRLYFDKDPRTDEDRTFADQLADPDDPPARSAFMMDGSFEWEKGLRLGLRYDTEGSDRPRWLMFRLDLFPWEGHNFGFFYASRDGSGGADLFKFDSLIGIGLRSRIWGPLDLFAEFTRRWRRVDDDMDFAIETGAGVGVSVAY